MKCKKSRYETLHSDEALAIRSFRKEALRRGAHAFFTIHVLVEGENGKLDQRISACSSVDDKMLSKLGFSTSVFEHYFDGMRWESKQIYTAFSKSVSSRLIMFTEEDFVRYLETIPASQVNAVKQARKQAKNLLLKEA